MKSYFENQTKLLLKVIGTALSNPSFALKGGTAINFFHANMPRLSVDIDLAYTKLNTRDEFLIENSSFFNQLVSNIQERHPSCNVQLVKTKELIPKQIIISEDGTDIKIECNLVIRGTVYPIVEAQTCEKIEQLYGLKIKVNTFSLEDLFAGKFCASLDRQHPRDLFDMMMFFKEHTITERLKTAFLVYLISGNRPISELIKPNRLNQRDSFQNEFMGVTDVVVSYEELEASRDMLISQIDAALTQQDRQFLLSFKSGTPDWSLLDVSHARQMPAVKWKLMNISKMPPDKHRAAMNELVKKLS